MVDPRGFRWPWEIVALLFDPEVRANSALVLELTHRLFAYLVGFLAIGMCCGFLATGKGAGRWLGAVVLAAVVAQGLLGRYRVDLNALLGPNLAMIHGIFAQLVFTLLFIVALITSMGWATQNTPAAPHLRRWALAMVALVFFQLMLGAMIRHQLHLGLARWHLVGAFVVFGGLVLLCKGLWDEGDNCRRWVVVVLCLLTLQILLGVEAWLGWSARVIDPSLAIRESVTMHWIRSAHYVLGAMIFAATVVLALKAHRGLAWSWTRANMQNLEAAA